MASIRKSLALSLAAKYSDLAISTASIIVIARLLTPAEIGVWSVGVAIAALAYVVRDFGVANYMIQEKELTPERISTALGVAIVIAWTMGLILVAVSGAIARFYGEPDLRQVLVVLSATFLIIPFSLPIMGLLRREMAYGALYIVSVANAIVHATTAITLAVLGYSFMSLAWATLVSALATLLVATILRPQAARFRPSLKEWQRVAQFGGTFSATVMIARIGGNAIDLIIGRILGFAALGLFSRANGLVGVFHRDIMGAIANIALSAFATQSRENQNLKTSYLKSICLVTVLAWPVYGFLGLMAFPIVRILFGSQWDAAVPLVPILATAVAIGATWNLISQVLIATGQVHRFFRSELIIQPTRILLIILAVPFGLEAVAASQIVFHFIGMLVYYKQLSYSILISYREVLEATSQSIFVTILSLIVPLVVSLLMRPDPASIWLPFILAAIGAVCGWIVGVAISNHPVKKEVDLAVQRLIVWHR